MYMIDCATATHCVAVGGGANKSHTPSARIYTTTDGKTFTPTLIKNFTGDMAYFFGGVQFVPGTDGKEVWVVGSIESQSSQAATWYSADGGMTWEEKQELNFIGAITDVSFANDGVGFASAITLMQDSTILRYTPTGAPVTPAPMYSGDFTQIVCNTSGSCGGECVKQSFPQNTCLNMTNGFSAQIMCDLNDNVMIQAIYPLDQVCWGPAEQQLIPLDQCLVGNEGTIKFECGPSASKAPTGGLMEALPAGSVKKTVKKH